MTFWLTEEKCFPVVTERQRESVGLCSKLTNMILSGSEEILKTKPRMADRREVFSYSDREAKGFSRALQQANKYDTKWKRRNLENQT
jgi:hypothetical protein